MGCLWGSKLAKLPDMDVCIFTKWTAQREKIMANGGIYLESIDGKVSLSPCIASSSPDWIKNEFGLSDFGFVFVKSMKDTFTSGEIAKTLLRPGGLLISFQNGMGREEILTEATDAKVRITVGTTSHGATVQPGEVIHRGEGFCNIAAIHPDNSDVEEVAEILTQSFGIQTQIIPVESKDEMLWRKLVVNCVINPLTAILGVKNGLISDGKLLHLCTVKEALITECVTVATKHGIQNIAFEDMQKLVEHVSHSTSPNTSSMLQDVRKHRPSEIDAINGYVVAKADEVGFDAGVNKLVMRLIREIEQGTRTSGLQNQEHLFSRTTAI